MDTGNLSMDLSCAMLSDSSRTASDYGIATTKVHINLSFGNLNELQFFVQYKL